jgi:hypothetical protein
MNGEGRSPAKNFIPQPLRRPASRLYWWWFNRGRHRLAAAASSDMRRSSRRLGEMKDRHLGQRCFILGNGPSLRRTDLTRLRHETTFGMNRIYLAFGAMGFPTTYYVAVNTLVIEQCAHDIRSLAMPKFVTWRGRRWLRGDRNIVFLDTDYTGRPTFSPDVRNRVFEGSTVTYVALQLAFHFGFDEVILIGVDHKFDRTGPVNATVLSEGDDRDHFDPGYFGRGFRWQLPDLGASEQAYRLARDAFTSAGRRVLDATIDGHLTVFPKVDYDSLFGGSQS